MHEQSELREEGKQWEAPCIVEVGHVQEIITRRFSAGPMPDDWYDD
jgi:hypothetical protein